MELRHLRYFVAVAEELHFSRAAARLHISQPPLSQQIQALEQELGATLFHRTKRRVELSDAGRLFLPEARILLEQARRTAQSVRLAGKGERGRLTVGFVTSATLSVLPRAVREFRSAYPGVDVDLKEMSPSDQIQALARREIDAGLLRPPLADSRIAVETVFSEPLVVALPSDHRLAAAGSVDLRELAAEPFILFPRRHGPGIADRVLQACREAGFSPRTVREPDEMTSILAYVAAGMGVSLVPGTLAGPGDLICFRELRGTKPTIDLVLAWPKGRPSLLVDNFRRLCLSIGKRCRQEVQRKLGRPRAGPARHGP